MSDAEFGAAVQAYLRMLGHEHRREPYQKAAISREYRDGPLAARSTTNTRAQIRPRINAFRFTLPSCGIDRTNAID